jgi:hypothetical protein
MIITTTMNDGSGGGKDNGGDSDGNDNDDNDNNDDDDDDYDNDDEMPLSLVHLLFDCCMPIKQPTCC